MRVPIACTLPGPELQSRLATIAGLAQRALLSYQQDEAKLRLRYRTNAAGELEEIVRLERQCCAFLDFELASRDDAIHLVITAPREAGEFAQLLMAHFVGSNPPQSDCASSCGCRSGSNA